MLTFQTRIELTSRLIEPWKVLLDPHLNLSKASADHSPNLAADSMSSVISNDSFIPALPPPSARVQSPISTIPIELLGKIFDFTYEKPGSYSCHLEMCSAALVSKGWTDAALERLWRTVLVDEPGQVERIATTVRETTYRTKTVRFRAEESAGWIERFLTRLVGVEHLEVGSCTGLAPFFLDTPALSGLTKLHIDLLVGPQNLSALALSSLPTRLTHLSLGPDVTSAVLLVALIITSRETLETLALEDCYELEVEFDSSPFAPIPPPPLPLTSLKLLRFNYTSSGIARAILPHATNLQRVECRVDPSLGKAAGWLTGVLDDVPGDLATFAFSALDSKRGRLGSVEGLNARLDAKPWEGLRHVLFSITEEQFSKVDGSAKLLARLKKRNPPVEVTFKYRPAYGHLDGSDDDSAGWESDGEDAEESSESEWETGSSGSDEGSDELLVDTEEEEEDSELETIEALTDRLRGVAARSVS